MNTVETKMSALYLEKVLTHLATQDEEAQLLLDSLADLIQKAKCCQLLSPVDNVPGEYWFQEGHLSKYPDLESAYSRFKLNATIKDSQQYTDFKEWAKQRKKDIFSGKS